MNTPATAESIFNAALDKPDPAERATFLAEACKGDDDLRRRVERLLQAHHQAGGFLERPIAQLSDDSSKGQTSADSDAKVQAPLDETQAEDAGRAAVDDHLAFLEPARKPGSLGRLDHYEILEVVGKGGFGIVLKAFDEKLHRVVAIKVLSPELATSGTARQRFSREARTAAAVTHEHVVTIHAVVDEHRPPYLVMQMIDGVTLQQKLDKIGTLSVREILRIGVQMAEGLAAAHKQGLVHRDIKPANILLENGIERVKISDFGLARAVDDASVTQSGAVAGTPMYMSPEQANGEPLDHRSDLFSLGTVLYVMCTGRPPFRASGTISVLKRVVEETPRPIREINPEIPEWLVDIINKLHAKKPEDRYQTAKEVAEVLGARLADVQAGRAIERAGSVGDGPATAPKPVTHASGSSRRWMAAALFLLFVGVTPLGVYLWNQYSASKRGQVDYELEEPRVKIIINGGGEESTYGGTTAVSEQRAAGITHTVRAYDRDGKEYFKHEFTVTPRGKTLVRIPAPPTTNPPDPGWVQLFNGKDLTGWKAVGNPQVKDGAIDFLTKGSVDTIKTLPAEFELRMEVKLTAGAAVIRSGAEPLQPQANPPPPKYGWSITLQNLGDRFHADVSARSPHRTEGPSTSLSYTNNAIIDKWFKLKIVAKNNRIRLRINDGDAGPIFAELKPGVLSLESMLPLNHIAFRNIEIKELPSGPNFALAFDGDDHVTIPSLTYDGKHPITLEAWVRVPRAPETEMHILGNAAISLRLNKDKWFAAVQDVPGPILAKSERYLSSTEPMAANRLTHVALVVFDREARLYVNGQRQEKGAALRADPVASGRPFVIGVRASKNAGLGLVGQIDELRISQSARYDRDFTPDKRFEPDKDTLALG